VRWRNFFTILIQLAVDGFKQGVSSSVMEGKIGEHRKDTHFQTKIIVVLFDDS